MLKQKIKRIQRRFFESIGSDIYSRPSLHEIDRKIEKYLPQKNGIFIEAGANDGFSYSNTYYFERFRNWTGILVEGIPELYEKCVLERPNSKVFNCALVSSDYQEPHVTMVYANAMSLVRGALKSSEADENHIKKGSEIQLNVVPYEIQVPARTLTSILDECQIDRIDLLSLDVEGFELNVLKGLDFNKYQPNFMLIEARFKEEIDSYISNLYDQIDQFSQQDFLYKKKD
ncbi:MAG: FkbM family methyltransferase [Hydrococcus sp. Prado102]|jgi:FkbM family methyltransferase|nr:FkbM family methyltransferase [Hydrococcus sp. Prado102]